jgi:glycosyltransferase involved in cell wall biosynthesis
MPEGRVNLGGSRKTEERIRILHLISGLDMGGAEKMLLWSARYHDRQSFHITVVSLMSGGVLADFIRHEGVEVHEMGQRRGRLSARSFLALLRTIRGFAPTIIQGHLFHSNMLVRVLALLVPGVSAVSTRHNERDSVLRRFLYALTSPLNRATIVFSDPVYKHARRDDLVRRPVRIASYGIDPVPPSADRDRVRSELNIPDEVFLWITVGRLTRQKGLLYLLEAFHYFLRESGPGPVLLIVGEGEERQVLEKKAAEMGITGHIRFLGRRFDVPDLLWASDAFVLSSLWEGGPLVVLEAMGAGLPVVATEVGDVAVMVQEDLNGLVVKPGDSSALAKAMGKVMSLGTGGRTWGEAGRKRVMDRYHFTGTQRSVENIYRDLAGFSQGG